MVNQIEQLKHQAEYLISKDSPGWTGLNPYYVLELLKDYFALKEELLLCDRRPVEEKKTKTGRYIHSIEETKNLKFHTGGIVSAGKVKAKVETILVGTEIHYSSE